MANDDSFNRRGDRGNDRRSGAGRDRSPVGGGGNKNKGGRSECRVFVSNLPYEYRWQDLKDLLRREVGEVAFVELFTDENDKPKGCGIVEFESPDSVKKAVDKLHRYDVDGRKIIVKEDYGGPRDKFGNLHRNRERDSHHRHDDNRNSNRDNRGDNSGGYVWGDTYGLSPSFLEGLNISPPLVCRIFVANLDYKVTEKKLRDVFKLAGKVRDVELTTDAEGKSRGFGVVEYDHPVESVQAISMLHNQQLYERRLIVRMDRVDSQERDRLPEGLSGVGMGLGQNGAPLKDVARNLPQLTSNSLSALQQTQNNLNSLTAAAALQAATPLSAAAAMGGLPALQAAAALAPSAGAGLMGAGNLDLLSRADLSRDLAFSNLANSLASGSLNASGLAGNLSASLNAAALNANSPSMSSGQGGYRNGSVKENVANDGHAAYVTSTGRESYDQRNSQMRASADTGAGKTSDTIVIDNLPPNFTWQQLKEKFRDVGEIKFAEMRGKLGLVRFNADWEALRAVSLLDRARVDGHPISVRLL